MLECNYVLYFFDLQIQSHLVNPYTSVFSESCTDSQLYGLTLRAKKKVEDCGALRLGNVMGGGGGRQQVQASVDGRGHFVRVFHS